jgi:hypothetical protein
MQAIFKQHKETKGAEGYQAFIGYSIFNESSTSFDLGKTIRTKKVYVQVRPSIPLSEVDPQKFLAKVIPDCLEVTRRGRGKTLTLGLEDALEVAKNAVQDFEIQKMEEVGSAGRLTIFMDEATMLPPNSSSQHKGNITF